MDIKRGYVDRYEERLAQQESGAALSNSNTYVSGAGAAIIQGVHELELMAGFSFTHAVQTEATCL